MIRELLVRKYRGAKSRVPHLAVERLGLPPSWVGYRTWRTETVREHLLRRGGSLDRLEEIHSEAVFPGPLPRNLESRDELPRAVGWWGYSFWDVPARTGGETYLARVPNCRVVHYVDPSNRQFYPSLLSSDHWSLEMREIRFRPEHAAMMRGGGLRTQRIPRATWILERVYHNYSHWLTAHLPKLLLLRERGELSDVLLPPNPPSLVRESLEMIGIDVDGFPTYDPGAVLEVGELTVLNTDRFRPELLRSVRDTFYKPGHVGRQRRIFVSRAKATRRRLVNEDEIWPILEREGFERLVMEDLAFAEQVALMRETAILFAIHGAGLTNMMFCAPGTHVVEVADLSFPNPNFYAVASAMGHRYWLLPGNPLGDEHPLNRDMHVDPEMIRSILPAVLAEA